MFSIPPATAASMLPSAISCAAETIACAPDRQTRVHGGLPGGIHLDAGLHDIAHHDGFHLVRAKLRACDCGADRHRSEIGSRHVFEATAEGTDCGANRFGEND